MSETFRTAPVAEATGVLKQFLDANKEAASYLAKKTTLLQDGKITKLVLSCADARIVVPGYFCQHNDLTDAVVYRTAAEAITDEALAALLETYNVDEVHVYGHQSCGGCGVRAMLDSGNTDGLTPELKQLGESLTNADPYNNAKDIARRFVAKNVLTIPMLARIDDGVVVGEQGNATREGYSPAVADWDMCKGQNPAVIVLNLGNDYTSTEYVKGSVLDALNAIFAVDVPHFDFNAQASLQYALSHAMKHNTNEAGHSFNDTETFVVMAPVSKEADALSAVETLVADATWQDFMSVHEVTGKQGKTYLCLHEAGAVQKVQEITRE